MQCPHCNVQAEAFNVWMDRTEAVHADCPRCGRNVWIQRRMDRPSRRPFASLRIAPKALWLVPYVALSSFLGCRMIPELFGGIWVATPIASFIFAAGSVAAGGFTYAASRRVGLFPGVIVGAATNVLVYFLSYINLRFEPGDTAFPSSWSETGESFGFVVSFGVFGLVFAALAPGLFILAEQAWRRTRAPAGPESAEDSSRQPGATGARSMP